MYRIIGAVLIITGLYLVLWGKSEEKKILLERSMIQTAPDHGSSRISGQIKPSITQPLLHPTAENVWLALNETLNFWLTRDTCPPYICQKFSSVQCVCLFIFLFLLLGWIFARLLYLIRRVFFIKYFLCFKIKEKKEKE